MVRGSDRLFGGVTMVFGGDWRPPDHPWGAAGNDGRAHTPRLVRVGSCSGRAEMIALLFFLAFAADKKICEQDPHFVDFVDLG